MSGSVIFNIGSSANAYGFNTAKEEMNSHLRGYMQAHPGNNPIVWFAAHSRGSAVANLEAADLIRNGQIDQTRVYAYCYACPYVSLKDTTIGSQAIRNFNSEADLVTRVPFSQWEYRRNGVTNAIEDMMSDSVNQGSNVFAQALYQLVPKREVYNMIYQKVMIESETFSYLKKAFMGQFDISEVYWTGVVREFAEILCDLSAKGLLLEYSGPIGEAIVAVKTAEYGGKLKDVITSGASYMKYIGEAHSSKNYRNWVLSHSGNDELRINLLQLINNGVKTQQ